MEELTKEELFVLDRIKADYDKEKRNPLAIVQPKMDVKIKKDIVRVLQNKGYLTITKKELDENLELITIMLESKFFAHFCV